MKLSEDESEAMALKFKIITTVTEASKSYSLNFKLINVSSHLHLCILKTTNYYTFLSTTDEKRGFLF